MSNFSNFLGPIAKAGITWLSRNRYPQIQGSVILDGLEAQVEVLRDRWGIPHIYASNRHDLFFAQGFVHAQDRLFQMELNRRTAQGRLSELFGELAFETDRAVRTFGFNRLAKADMECSSSSSRKALQAYADGVNAFLNQPNLKLPVEFVLLGHRPEPWQPLDSLAFTRVMIWQLSHAWYGEIVRAQIAEAIGLEHAADLEIYYSEANPTTLPKGIEFNRLDPDGLLRKVSGPFLEQGKGSNAWTISRSKSNTGHTILCNDMHLAIKLPSLWYEMHLEAPDYHVTGVSLPGVPVILVGHNERIGWGMTLAYTDCEDLFVEHVDPERPNRYQFQGQWEEAEVIEEPIRIKGQTTPRMEKVIVTRHGPVISDVVGYPQQRLAVSSMALRPCPALQGWLQLNTAQGWDEFVEAMRLIEAPQLNVAYTDIDENIGYWVTGKVPIRGSGSGEFPSPGWTGEHEWTGEVPFEEMPHALNPEQGFLVTCNNKIISDDYPYFLGNAWMKGYRARRIENVLRSKEKISIEDCQRIQMDFTCLPGEEFISRLENIQSLDPDVLLALNELRSWNGQLTPDSVGGAVYEVTRYTLIRNILDPCLGKELAVRVLGQGFHPLLLFSNEFYGNDIASLFRILDNPDSWWLQKVGGREAAISRSLKEAVQWLRSNVGPEMKDWQWGKIHRVSFEHPLGLQKPLDQVFNRGPFPIGGDTDTPCQTASAPNAPDGNNFWSPSVRMIFDMGDLSRSLSMFPPGQSGQLGNTHYDDFIQPWLKGEYHLMLWTREQVEKESEGLLTLKGTG